MPFASDQTEGQDRCRKLAPFWMGVDLSSWIPATEIPQTPGEPVGLSTQPATPQPLGSFYKCKCFLWFGAVVF